MICRRSVQKRLRRKIRSGKDKIVLRSLADMDIIKEKEVLFMNIETIKNAVLKLIDQYPSRASAIAPQTAVRIASTESLASSLADRKSTRLNSSHSSVSRMPSSA